MTTFTTHFVSPAALPPFSPSSGTDTDSSWHSRPTVSFDPTLAGTAHSEPSRQQSRIVTSVQSALVAVEPFRRPPERKLAGSAFRRRESAADIPAAARHRPALHVGRPRVSYRETIKKGVKKVEGTCIRQTGGAGLYAKVSIDLEPESQPRGAPVLE